MLKIVTIIQSRIGSTRFYGKVLKPLAGKPLLLRLYERVNAAKLAGTIVVAITTDPEDDDLLKLCESEYINVHRGCINDLLDRHYQAALKYNADAVVKIPSDCPLIDPDIIDKVISYFLQHSTEFDYVSNLHPPSYPDGNDVEIMTMDALRTAWKEAKKDFEREHTTPYIWENPDNFRIGNVTWESGLDYSMTHRFTIDYPEDYDFIKSVYDELYPKNPLFKLTDILGLLKKKPELMNINSKYAGVNWYRNHLSELKTIKPEQTKIL